MAWLAAVQQHYEAWWGVGWWWIWWVIWIVIIVWAFAWWSPWSADRRPPRLTPGEVLQHRLARGEITPEEYERCKALLDRDTPRSPR